jgi:uncharacterized membrane protein
VEIATFSWYSPLGYVPQTVAVGAGRAVGLGVVGTLRLARLAVLGIFVVIVTVALRRSPRARWGLLAIAVLPMTLFEVSSSVSPDAITIALAILVVSSALRMCADPGRGLRSELVEAAVLSFALALAKPTYGLVALIYVLPAWRGLADRSRWSLVACPVTAMVAAGLWQRSMEHLWICDNRFFGIEQDPPAQIERLLEGPHRFLVGLARDVTEHAGRWADDLIQIGERVVGLPRWVAVLSLGLVLVLAVVREDGDGPLLRWPQRVWLMGLFGAGMLVLFGGWYVYCNPVGFDLAIAPSARLFVPFLPLVVVAVGSSTSRSMLLSVRQSTGIGVVVSLLVAAWIIAAVTRLT